jgi:hypothetical protein
VKIIKNPLFRSGTKNQVSSVMDYINADAPSAKLKQNHPHELTPKSWTPCPTKGVLFYEQVQQAVQAKGS